jgi:hypothetical protein
LATQSSAPSTKFFLALFFATSLVCARARADAAIIENLDVLDPIWLVNTQVDVTVENEGNFLQKYSVKLEGGLKKWDTGLVYENRPIHLNGARHEFKLPVELTSRRTEVPLTVVDQQGKLIRRTIIISYAGYQAKVNASSNHPSLGGSWTAGVGIDLVHISEDLLPDISETAIQLRLGYQHPLGGRWDFAADGFYDVALLANNETTTPTTALPVPTSLNGHFFGLNGRVGYALPLRNTRWSLGIAGGIYYVTMVTPGTSFGFRNLGGPQLFPIVRRQLGSRDSVSLSFKYSPVMWGTTPSFANHEFAVGGGWTRALPNRRTLGVLLDYRADTIASASVHISANSTALTFVCGF